jgi:hypothetical protein
LIASFTPKSSFQVIEKEPVIRRKLRGVAVVNPISRATVEHEPGFLEVGQMPGHVRLRGVQNIPYVAAAQFALQEKVQNSKPANVGQPLEENL